MIETCLSLKDMLIEYLAEFTTATQDGDECVITVPINTLDDRWIDITVVEKAKDFFVVSDAGKSCDELFLQGMSISEGRVSILREIARRYSVNLVNEAVFMTTCPRALLQHSIWAVAQSSSMAMGEILRHKPSSENDSETASVGIIIKSWSNDRRGVIVNAHVSSKGKMAQHVFDFLVSNEQSVVAVNVLNPSAGARAKAERYGFQALDLEGTYVDAYKKLAVLAKPNEWSTESRRIVSKMATEVVEFYHPANSQANLIRSLSGLLLSA